jgi:hypothetical protein
MILQCVWCRSPEVVHLTDAVVAPWAVGVDDLTSPKLNSRLFRCAACGLQYFTRRYSDSELHFLYNDYRGESYLKRRRRWEPWYSNKRNHSIGHDEEVERTRKLAVESFLLGFLRHMSELRIVDYGGDEGQFIPSLPNTSFAGVYDVSGLPSRAGIVKLSSVQQVHEVSPNLIMLCHVLEHLADPRAEFESILELLCPQGLIYIEVPLDYHRVKLATPPQLIERIRSHRIAFILSDLVSQICRFKFSWNSRFRLIKQSEHLQFFSLPAFEMIAPKLKLTVLGSFTYTSDNSVGTPETLGILVQRE